MKQSYVKPTIETTERMRKVKSRGTSIEKEMEKLLKGLKIKYHRQPKLEGNPDFRIKGTNVLIFCDSSFWHGRREKEITGKAFRKNREYWVNKLKNNKKRDERIRSKLRRDGWSVWRFWDTDINKNQVKVKSRLLRIIDAQ
ncbi:very short patch repair endonuclease [candidate division LCP-89 bacterium B3_LCP]|uniref:Very short patch repair endonuclease n=1 Tax=candidate division LCP-89 bacterium B3_LCP TaxID=2012998 RepID=A0A532UYP1_UNCL8|nr:MAG: very short patch repair endonuclease [candidate division LCP-89 bacterium B3_LCP]